MPAIKTEHLRKVYRDVTAVDDLNLSIEAGELFALLGVNGAGKTTTIKMLSCLCRPTGGDALLGGKSVLRDTAAEMNLAVVARGREIRRERMGTTAAVLCVTREEAHIAHIGDSRIYRFRGGRLSALTEDDILRREHGQVLTQYLGVEPSAHSIHPHIRKGALRSGDLFLLCTDGVHGALSEREIAAILRRYGRDPTKCVETLTEQALEKNGEDNATAIVVRFYKKPWWRTIGKGV